MRVAVFCRRPGAPSSRALSRWLRQEAEGLLEPPARAVGGSAAGRPKYKRYSEETKAEAVRLVRAGNKPADVARRLGVLSGATLVRTWVRRAAGEGTSPQRGAVRMEAAAQERIAELERALDEERARNEVLREMMCDPKAGDPARLPDSGKAELGERLRADLGWPLRDVADSRQGPLRTTRLLDCQISN